MKLTAVLCLVLYFNGIKSNQIQVTMFTRISQTYISSLGCGGNCCAVSCASNPQCSGYLVTAVHDCIMITDGDIETACSAASATPACYSRNGAATVEQTLSIITTQASLPDTTQKQSPQGCVESIRQTSGGHSIISFHNTDTMMKYSRISEYFAGDSGEERNRSLRFPDLTTDVRDKYFAGGDYAVIINGE